MINEKYELSYDLFLAENDLFKDMLRLRSTIINESSITYTFVNESIQETIAKYITKITDAIQKAWDKIKEIFTNGPETAYLKAIQPIINSAKSDPNFSINNFKVYQDNKFDSIQLIPFDYANMKDNLNSEESFINRYYPQIQDTNNIEQEIENIVVSNIVENFDIRLQDIKELHSWCLDNYKTMFNSVSDDISKINASNKNIQNMLSSISPIATESIVYNAYNNFNGYYITEAENDNEDKMNIVDDKDENGENKEKQSTIVQEIRVYMSASTSILTAKMNVLKNRRKEYIKIITHYIPNRNIVKDENGNNTIGAPKLKEINI